MQLSFPILCRFRVFQSRVFSAPPNKKHLL